VAGHFVNIYVMRIEERFERSVVTVLVLICASKIFLFVVFLRDAVIIETAKLVHKVP
jgi:hypothetical protein